MHRTMATRASTNKPPSPKSTSQQPASQRPRDTSAGANPEGGPTVTLADLNQNLSDFSGTINAKLDKMDKSLSAINNKFDELEKSVGFNSDKLNELEITTLPQMKSTLDTKIQKLEEKLILSEIQNRKSNLLIYGMQVKQGEDVIATLQEAFNILGVQEEAAASIAIVNAHRLPRRNPDAGRGPVPIIAKFCFMRDRDLILKAYEDKQRKRDTPPNGANAQLAPGTRISVRTDLPPTLKIRRGILANEAYKMRKERGLSTKIVLEGATVTLYYREKGTAKWNAYKD